MKKKSRRESELQDETKDKHPERLKKRTLRYQKLYVMCRTAIRLLVLLVLISISSISSSVPIICLSSDISSSCSGISSGPPVGLSVTLRYDEKQQQKMH